MPFYPGADTSVKGSSPGSYVSSPWKLIIHTTEGGSAEGAFSAYRANGTWPHATIDNSTIYQHLSTDTSGSALKNLSGGVETNRARAIQIEMVAYAGSAKNHAMLGLVAEFCAWVESVHGVAHTWPAGRPKGSGGPHNRSTTLWTTESGYYGHSQAPESDHWDPGYLSDEELDILMGGVVQPLKVYINDTPQTDAVKGFLHDANSLVDLSDWCAYSKMPPAEFDNAAADDTYAGAVHIWTHKTTCQVLVSGEACGAPTVGLALFPILNGAAEAFVSACAAHQPAATAPSPEQFAALPPAAQRYIRALERRSGGCPAISRDDSSGGA